MEGTSEVSRWSALKESFGLSGKSHYLAYLKPSRAILSIIIIGLAIRFIVAPFTSYPYDTYSFYVPSVDMLNGLSMYDRAVFSYPPLFPVVLYPFVWLLSAFVDPSSFGAVQYSMVDIAQKTQMMVPFVTSPAFNLALKTPLILADLLMGLVLYNFVRENKNEVWAKRIFLLWFLNPLVIWTSSIQGQFDVIPALLTVLALIAFYKRHFILTGLFIGVGIFFKLYPSYLAIFYLLATIGLAFTFKPFRISLRSILPLVKLSVGYGLSILMVFPFFLASGLGMQFIMRRSNSTNYGGMNLWPLFNNLPRGNLVEGPGGFAIDIATIMYFAAFASVFILAVVFRKKTEKEIGIEQLVATNILILAALLILQPVTNPQHLLWLIPFLLMGGIYNSTLDKKMFALSVLGVIYFVSLMSFAVFFYPTAVYTGLFRVEDLNAIVLSYFTGSWYISEYWALQLTSIAALVVLLSLFLPKRFDPVGMSWDAISGLKARVRLSDRMKLSSASRRNGR